jgi:hypothetical protein
MELEGSLKTFSLPEVLQFLSMSKMTGTLAVSSSSRVIRVMIHDGKIVNTSSLNLSRKLGTILINHNKIHRHQLDEALAVQRKKGGLLGQILVDEKFLTQEELNQTIKMQLEEEVWDLFRLGDGDFKFEHGEALQPEEIIVEIDIEPLIMEGTRQLDEWNRIIKHIPNDDYIVRLSPLEGEFEKIPLTDHEWAVLSYINGRSSIGSIVNRSTIGKFETYQALNSFLAAGMVMMVSPEEFYSDPTNDGGGDPEDFVIPMGGGESLLSEGSKRNGGASPNLMNKYFQNAGQDEIQEMAGKYVFMSPVGQVAEYISRYMKTLWDMPEFQPGPEDGVFLERRWSQMLNEYIRADVIEAGSNTLNAQTFERFVGFFGGIAASLSSTFEDCMSGLQNLNEEVKTFTTDRVSAKAIEQIQSQVLPDMNSKSILRFKEEGFELSKFVS